MYHGEKFNSITHLVGAVLALVGFGALLTVGVQESSWQLLASFCVFGFTLVLLYTMSTLYHSFHPPKLKRLFQKLDHVSIYLLIAGTYTPYMMISLRESQGLIMLAAVWSLAILGFILELTVKRRIEILQISIYLLMGWICVFKFSSLQVTIAAPGIIWLVIGGLSYTIGIVFYVLDHKDSLSHAHGIWHLFVLLGSVSHFISIMGYVR